MCTRKPKGKYLDANLDLEKYQWHFLFDKEVHLFIFFFFSSIGKGIIFNVYSRFIVSVWYFGHL